MSLNHHLQIFRTNSLINHVSALVLTTGTALFVSGCSASDKTATANDAEILNDANAYHAIYDSKKPVLVEFCAPWAESSKQTAPIMSDLAAEFTDVRFVRVDTDKAPQTMQMFEIETVPTFILVSKKCKHGKQLTGVHTKSELAAFISESYAECHD